MKKLSEVVKSLKEELTGLLNVMLVSERMNSQRCLAKDIDTTKTIIDHKDESEELTQEDLNRLGKELSKISKEIKVLGNTMLVSERLNNQECLAKDIDTTKTILDPKNESKEFDKVEIKELVDEAKVMINTILVSERLNSQRCIAKDIDTTKTILDHKDESEEISKKDLNKIVQELGVLMNTLLVSERLNSQRCLAKDIDTTKTIIDQKK